MSLLFLLLCNRKNLLCECSFLRARCPSRVEEDWVAPEVQPQGRESHGIASLRNCGIWWRSRSFIDGLRCLHAVEHCVWSPTRINDSGLFLRKPGVWTALDTIYLIYGMGGESNGKILSMFQGAISTHMLVQPFCVFLDKLLFNTSFISQEVLFHILL